MFRQKLLTIIDLEGKSKISKIQTMINSLDMFSQQHDPQPLPQVLNSLPLVPADDPCHLTAKLADHLQRLLVPSPQRVHCEGEKHHSLLLTALPVLLHLLGVGNRHRVASVCCNPAHQGRLERVHNGDIDGRVPAESPQRYQDVCWLLVRAGEQATFSLRGPSCACWAVWNSTSLSRCAWQSSRCRWRS